MSTKSEWMAFSKAVKDILLLKNLCNSMGIHITSPTKMRIDNMGAVFMSNNIKTSSHTKHIDIQRKFVKEFVQGGVIVVGFSEWRTMSVTS